MAANILKSDVGGISEGQNKAARLKEWSAGKKRQGKVAKVLDSKTRSAKADQKDRVARGRAKMRENQARNDR